MNQEPMKIHLNLKPLQSLDLLVSNPFLQIFEFLRLFNFYRGIGRERFRLTALDPESANSLHGLIFTTILEQSFWKSSDDSSD